MEQVFLDKIYNNFPAITFVLFLLIVAVWASWKVFKFYSHIDSAASRIDSATKEWEELKAKYFPEINAKLVNTDRRLDNVELRLGNVERRLDNVEIRLDSMDKRLVSLETKMTTLVNIFRNKFKIKHDIFRANSPRQLSPFGALILEKAHGKKYVDDHEIELIQRLEKLTPKSGFDVEQYSLKVLQERVNDDSFIPLKNYIFNNPVFKHTMTEEGEPEEFQTELDMDALLSIMGVYLRNAYLAAHPELNTQE